MTYHELVEKAKEVYEHADASEVRGHLAVQFNVTGEGEGAFYIEITDGNVEVMPYEYYDRDAIIYIPGPVLYEIIDGKIKFEDAYNELMLGIEGDLGAALLLKQVRLKRKDKDNDKTKEKKEDIAEDTIQEQVEREIEDITEGKIENEIEDIAKEKAEGEIKDITEGKKEENVEDETGDSIEETIGNEIEDLAEGSVEN